MGWSAAAMRRRSAAGLARRHGMALPREARQEALEELGVVEHVPERQPPQRKCRIASGGLRCGRRLCRAALLPTAPKGRNGLLAALARAKKARRVSCGRGGLCRQWRALRLYLEQRFAERIGGGGVCKQTNKQTNGRKAKRRGGRFACNTQCRRLHAVATWYNATHSRGAAAPHGVAARSCAVRVCVPAPPARVYARTHRCTARAGASAAARPRCRQQCRGRQPPL